MLNIPDVVKELFMQDGIRKNFRVHFPNGERADLVNKDIVEERVKFTESTCSQQTLRFGLTEASVIEFECVGVENIAGMTIECGIEIDVSSLGEDWAAVNGEVSDDVDFPFYAVPYGVFLVESCKRQIDLLRRKVIAYTKNDFSGFLSFPFTSKIPSITTYMRDYLRAISLKKSDFTDCKVTRYYNSDIACNSNATLYFRLHCMDWMLASVSVPGRPNDNRVCVIKYSFNPDPFDRAADTVYASARRSLPSGAYVYETNPDRTCTQQYASIAQAAACGSGMFSPFVSVLYRTNPNTSAGPTHYRTYPRKLTAPEGTIIINPKEDLRAYGGQTFDYYGYTVMIQVPVYYYASRNARWSIYNPNANTPTETDYPMQGWPFSDGHTCDRNLRVQYAVFEQSAAPDAVLRINPTGKVGASDIGPYFEYMDAVQRDDAANDIIAVFGFFGNIERDGTVSVNPLMKRNAFFLPRSLMSAVWYEERETDKIGSARFKYNDGTDDLEGDFVFNSSAPGVYDFLNNSMLTDQPDRSEAGVLSRLQYFPDGAAEAFYTPIDIQAKGLPWLEDGDAVTIETPDGNVDSYILRRTLSGVQHLVDEIEANGEV